METTIAVIEFFTRKRKFSRKMTELIEVVDEKEQ